jgi:hypothetical protein
MKTAHVLPIVLLTAGLLILPQERVAAQTDQDAIAVVRSVIKADRQAIVAQTLQCNGTEAQAFWPLYHQYRAEMDEVGDGLVKLVQEYAANYPNVPENRAKQMLKTLMRLEKKRIATRTAFLKKFGKILPADKNLRFAQVENRLDLALLLDLAGQIPLVPVEGNLSLSGSSSTAFAAGVPGGASTQTIELTATVAAIDKATRKITLLSSEGFKKTVKAGPEVVNFDQIHAGDQLKITATEQLVVRMAHAGEPIDDGTTGVVTLAPQGAKPEGVIAETSRVTATITTIDLKNRTATLRFEDGSTHTLPVRRDVDLSKHEVGQQVVFRVTEMIAIRVEKP